MSTATLEALGFNSDDAAWMMENIMGKMTKNEQVEFVHLIESSEVAPGLFVEHLRTNIDKPHADLHAANVAFLKNQIDKEFE